MGSNNTIQISWHIDDVKSVDASLSDDQCREVLRLLKKNHDAGIGINWDVIEITIERMLDV